MGFINWFFNNFGILFGGLFIVYLFFIIHRLIILYDLLRHVPKQRELCLQGVLPNPAFEFLFPYLCRLAALAPHAGAAGDAIIDAVWAQVDARVAIHFSAINNYVYSLILVGFAGTIFGAIGAFSKMLAGMSGNIPPAQAFMQAWNSGLSTALYTSLGSAGIGGIVITLLYSRYLTARAKSLESMIGVTLSDILTGQSYIRHTLETGFNAKESDHGTPQTKESH